MDLFLKEYIMEESENKVKLHGKMVVAMKDFLKMINLVELENITGGIKGSMRGSGKMGKWMEKEN